MNVDFFLLWKRIAWIDTGEGNLLGKYTWEGLLYRPPEEAIEASDQQALIAPHIQDDFKDVNEEELQDTAIQNVEALQVSTSQ